MFDILLLRPKIGIGLGGAENHAAQVAIKLMERGFRVGIIAHTIKFPKDLLHELIFYQVRFKGFGSLPKHFLFIYQAKKILSSLKTPHRVISFFRYPHGADLFILCDPLICFLKEQKASLFTSLRLRYKLLTLLEKKALLNSKKVISLFSLGKSLVAKYYPEASHKTFVCYRGIDRVRFTPLLKKEKGKLRNSFGLGEEDFILLFVGYDTQRKGLDLLLEIMPYLPSKVKLLIAGKDGPSTERVKFLGKVKEIEKLYALSDLFVLPTFYDPGAQSTLEALASGTPVITTPYDGTSEFVKDGLNGFIVERNIEALKEAILKALYTPFDPQRISKTVESLTWDNYVDCLINHLD